MSPHPTGPRPPDDPAPETHRDYLYRFALLQLRDPHLAEDAVQETLLAAVSAKSGFAGKSSARTWLTGILKHKIADLVRKQSRETPLADAIKAEGARESDEFDALFRENEHWSTPPRDWGDPERTLESKHFWEVFEICAKLMSPAVARVFMMREIQGLTTDEICKEAGISTTNCWVMLHRARMSLRICLEQKWVGGGRP
jgi:RNA polymerase sigma-70 factor (ECF subfamily)